MKAKLFKAAFAIFLMVAFFSSCNQAPKSGSDSAKVTEPVDYTQFRNEFLEIIRDTPKAIDVADFLASVGASYIDDITLPLISAEKVETRYELALLNGMLGMDIYYAYAFGRYDVVFKDVKTLDMILDRLGFSDNSPGHEGIDLYENNADSVQAFLVRNWQYYQDYLVNGENPELIAMMFVGGNIEAMYLLSQLNLFAKDNQAMTDYLMQKGKYAGSLLRLLEILSDDPAIKPYYEMIQPVVKFFETHEVIGHNELVELSDLIKNVRNKVIS